MWIIDYMIHSGMINDEGITRKITHGDYNLFYYFSSFTHNCVVRIEFPLPCMWRGGGRVFVDCRFDQKNVGLQNKILDKVRTLTDSDWIILELGFSNLRSKFIIKEKFWVPVVRTKRNVIFQSSARCNGISNLFKHTVK